MSSAKKTEDVSLTPVPSDRPAKDGGISSKLLEQVNAKKINEIWEAVSSKADSSATPTTAPNQGGSMNPGLLSFLKWSGLSLPLVIAIVGATVWINNTIDSKVRENRLELKSDIDSTKNQLNASIDSAKLELKTESIRMQDDVRRLDEKMDRKMDKLSDQLTSIQQDIRDSKK